MSAEHFLRQAAEIEQHAADVEYEQQRTFAANTGAAASVPPDRSAIVQKYLGTVTDRIEPFSRMPDPGQYDGMISAARAAMEKLSPGALTDPVDHRPIPANEDLAHIGSAGDILYDWVGAAADSFKVDFLDLFRTTATNQFILMGTLRGALQAHQAIWRRAGEDVHRLIQKTNYALDNVTSSGKNQWDMAISVASAVAAIGALPATAGASLGFAVVGAASATASAGEQVTAQGGGGSAEQVVRSMQTTLDRIADEIRRNESKISAAVLANIDMVHRDKRKFVSPRPALAGMRATELLGDDGLGDAR